MIFDRPWALLLLILPVLWCVWEWRNHVRHVSLLLKTISFAAAALALASPVATYQAHKVALAVLADVSASLSTDDAARVNTLIRQIAEARGSNHVQLIPFARNARPATSLNDGVPGTLPPVTGAEGRATNLELPIRQALATLPEGLLHRIVVLTDGNENEGAVTRAAWQARQVGVPIDMAPLSGRVRPLIRMEAVGLPAQVFAGEKFPINLTIFAPTAVTVTVELAAEGKAIGTHTVALASGQNRVRIRASLDAEGATDLTGRIAAANLGESRFENAIDVRRPNVIFVSQDPPGTEKNLATLLGASHFDFTLVRALPASLEGAQIVVFNNLNFESVKPEDKQRIETFVQQGGGALWIAGESNTYVDRKGAPEDALERTFPAKLAPPKSPEQTVVVLVMDKSASMEGKKIELSRSAATGVVENLRPDDQIGILMFDNTFQWIVPIRKADDKAAIKRQIAGIVPDGGTQIPAALNEAYRKILPVSAMFKHIVLLTDGISEEGNSLALAKEAVANKVTISTIGLGQDVNKPYLDKIATGAEGKSYFLTDPSGLEQILLKDVKEHTGTTAVEKTVRAQLKHESDLLDKVDIPSAPALGGYVKFEMKPSGDEVLNLDNPDGKDPLLARWQYGLGRAIVFASDAKARWASGWLSWNGFDPLWTNIFRDLLPRGSSSEAVTSYDAANQEIVVDYHLSKEAPAPELFALGPGDFHKPVDLARVAPNTWRARVKIGAVQGLFRIRPLEENKSFPETGLYRPEAEMNDFGSNQALMKSVAGFTGGRYNPTVAQMFSSGGRYIESSLKLWPLLLSLAVLLNLAELVVRKGRGLFPVRQTR